MRLDAPKLGIAIAFVFALFWVVCSILVVLIPSAMMQMSGHMIHADLGAMGWSMHWTGFVIGLVLWSVISGLLVWAIASVYNRLTG